MATKKWTMMVYLAGDNNLDGAGVTDLDEMKQVGTNNDINILAQFDRAGAKVATIRYCLRKGTSLAKDAVMSLGETNTGNPAVLQSFLEWGIANYPAERYAMVLWNHGSGWDDNNIYRAARAFGLRVTRRRAVLQATKGKARGQVQSNRIRAVAKRFGRSMFAPTLEAAMRDRAIAFDDQAKDFLDNVEMKSVFSAIKAKLGRKVDLLGLDACLMNMLEVAYQVRDSVAYVAGSEETEPGDGWPYHTILASLAANPAMKAADLSALIVTKYLASYSAADGVTQSALDLAQVMALRTAVENLGQGLCSGLQVPSTRLAILDARRRVRHYNTPEYVDLLDLCRQIASGSVPAALKTACNAVVAAIKPLVVKNGSKGSAVTRSNGVSIYFPENGVSPLYKTLDFAKQSQWARFIGAYQA